MSGSQEPNRRSDPNSSDKRKIVTGPNDVLSDSIDDSPPSMSTTLLAGLQALEPEAWSRLTRLYGPVVYGWCKRQGLQSVDVEDVVQEVFRAVLERVSSFRRERADDTFRGWLWTITRNKLADHFRKRLSQPEARGGTKGQARLAEVPVLPSEGPSSSDSDLGRRGLALIQSEFEETTWKAFWRVVCEDERPADTAAALGLTLNAVYLAKSRVLRRLREVLGDVAEDDNGPDPH
jgi:RNA polymerase sigma-70 factor (ECF subfamily)